MYTIIQASTTDLIDTARTLFVEYAEQLGHDLSFQGFAEELAGLPGNYAPPSGRIVIAVEEGTAVGCVAVRDLGDGICEMKRLYVTPEFRGRGIGRALASAVIDEARKIGYKKMRLDTIPELKPANALYRSLGFREIEPYRYNPLENPIFMELDLV